MGETIKIVTKDFPVDKLPEELRRGIESGQMVSVTVESKEPAVKRRSMRSFVGAAPGLYASPEDAVDYVRRLRDESDR